jgi:hypothetical protein
VSRTSQCEYPADNDLADIREKLYSPKGLVYDHVGTNDESAVTAFHKEISKKLVKLCGDGDKRSIEIGVEIILKLVGYSKPLRCTSFSTADRDMKLGYAGQSTWQSPKL